MALIICPECGKQVSNQAKQCIHCGYPLNSGDICIIDGVEVDLTEFKAKILQQDFKNDEIINKLAFELAMKSGSLNKFDSLEIIDSIKKTGEIPHSFTTTYAKKQRLNQIRCPKCSSTSISTGSRGYSLAWGFIGANKTVNRCANCGYKWEPRK